MTKIHWALKGILFMVVIWLIVYVGIPYFDAEKPMEVENNLLNLFIALPAGVGYGYYRYKYLPARMKARKNR